MKNKPNDYVTRADFPQVKDWTKWDEIVNRVKREIADLLELHKHHLNKMKETQAVSTKPRMIIYCYDKDGVLTNEFVGIRSVCEHFQVSLQTVVRYSQNQWIVKEHLLSREFLTSTQAIELYKNRLSQGKVYLSLEKTSGMLGKCRPIYGYNKDGQLVGVYDSATVWKNKFTPNSRTIQYSNFTDERRIDGIMYSYGRYDTDEAKQRYIKSKTKILKR